MDQKPARCGLRIFYCLFFILGSCSGSTYTVDNSGPFHVVNYKPYPEPQPFPITQIACNDISTPQSRATVQKVKDNPLSDIYWPSNEATDIVKKVADQGNVDAIFFFGDMRYERIFIDHMELRDKSHERVEYPSKARGQMIEALTYIYVANYFDTPHQQDISALIKRIEENKSDLTIPFAWIQEGHANAEHWKKYCDRSNY